MKKKEQIKKLKHQLMLCESKRNLLKGCESSHLFLIKENASLKEKIEQLESDNEQLRGVLFNYQTMYMAGH